MNNEPDYNDLDKFGLEQKKGHQIYAEPTLWKAVQRAARMEKRYTSGFVGSVLKKYITEHYPNLITEAKPLNNLQ